MSRILLFGRDTKTSPDWRTYWSLYLQLLLLLTLGCGGPTTQRHTHRGSRSATPQQTVAASSESQTANGNASGDSAVETGSAPPDVASSTVLVRSSPPSPGDPEQEGWTSEAFSETASRQLKLLGHWLTTTTRPANAPQPQGDNTGAAVSHLFSARFSSDAWRPEMEQVLHNHQVLVERTSERRRNKPDHIKRLTHWQSAAASLLEQFEGMHPLHSKFKLFRVQTNGETTSTRQYVHLSGRGGDQAREYNATWEIQWSSDSTDPARPPRITSVDIIRAEQVTAQIAHRPWLTDNTASLLANDPATQSDLAVGISHWMTRTESTHGVYNFGHHGMAIGDVNRDGLDDIYLCQTGNLPNHLLIQQPDGTVRDTAAAAGVDFLDNTRSALLIDLDNDGDQDLITALNSGLLFMENSGRGEFAMRARIRSVRQAFSLAAADYDQDGLLDLYVCVYYGSSDEVSRLPLPVPYFDATNGGKNILIRNRGNWRFQEVTEDVGLDGDNRRFSLAAIWEDVDRDGDVDLYVVNDFGPNQLFRNDRSEQSSVHQFSSVAEQLGLQDHAFGMSVTIADFDHNLHDDIYISNMFSAAGNRVTFQPRFKPGITERMRSRFQYLARGNSLFQNQGDGTFVDVSRQQRVTMGRWSWGAQFADINNDSWDDLLVGNGYVTGKLTDDL